MCEGLSVSGDVTRLGVYEIVMGGKLSDLLGLDGADEVKIVKIGGATGRVVPASHARDPSFLRGGAGHRAS